uniref:Secreted protein n=1 Tax=Caenorhabditis tropicalis TaxID=1561998 RepID=A0A1I7TUV7_9PELO
MSKPVSVSRSGTKIRPLLKLSLFRVSLEAAMTFLRAVVNSCLFGSSSPSSPSQFHGFCFFCDIYSSHQTIFDQKTSPVQRPGSLGQRPGQRPGLLIQRPGQRPGWLIQRPGQRPGWQVQRPGQRPGSLKQRPGWQVQRPGWLIQRPGQRPGSSTMPNVRDIKRMQ